MEPVTVAIKIGGSTGLAMLAVGNLESGSVGLAVAVPCTVFIGGVVWWLGRKFQQIDDSIKRMDDRIGSLPCTNCPHKK